MKTNPLFICLMILGVLTSSCEKETIRASRSITVEKAFFSDYSALSVASAFKVNVTFSDSEEKIEIEANENLHNRIIVKKEGNTLVIRLKRNTNLRGDVTLNVFITTKEITDFEVSGASSMLLESQLNTASASIELSGASSFTGEIEADVLDLESSGASAIDLYGNIDRFNVELTGASTLRDYDLIVKELDVALVGASNAFLTVMERIDIRATGASILSYKGAAVIGSQNLTGSSQIIKKN